MSVDAFTLNLINEYTNKEFNEDFETSMLETLLRDQKYDLVLLCLQKRFLLTREIRQKILKTGNLPLYQYLIPKFCKLNSHRMELAIKSGNLETVKWIQSIDSDILHFNYLKMAVSCGHLEIAKWIRSLNDDNYLCLSPYAIFSGNLEMVEWIHSQKVEWNKGHSELAVRAGNLLILKWLREHECPFTKKICSIAAEYGQLEILQYLYSLGYALREDTAASAARWGHQHVLEWLKEKGVPLSERVYQLARHYHSEMIPWLEENDCSRCTIPLAEEETINDGWAEWCHKNVDLD